MDTTSPPPDAIEIFLSYSRRDEALCDELKKHLSILQTNGFICWNDRAIPVGTEWEDQIDDHLNSAQIILLLISPDFLASRYICNIELKRALERHQAKEAVVISIILRDVDWQSTQLRSLQALPKDAVPITSLPNQDKAFRDIAVAIRKVAERLRHHQPPPPPIDPPGHGEVHQEESHHRINRAALYAMSGILVIGVLASLAYYQFRRSGEQRQRHLTKLNDIKDWSTVKIESPLLSDCMDFQPCVARREHANKLRAVQDWRNIQIDSLFLGDCMDFQPCVARQEQADKLRAVEDWKDIPIDSLLLTDCMHFQPCMARSEQADKLQAVKDWKDIPIDSLLLTDCMRFQLCVGRSEQAKRLKAIADWKHIKTDFPFLDDCMALAVCVARRNQADRLRAVSDWTSIGQDSPLLNDCMGFQKCVDRRKQFGWSHDNPLDPQLKKFD